MTIDDDPDVLRAIERDLRSRYGADYRIVRAASGPETLDVLARLALRDQPVALLLADHRMPQMTGIELLARAVERVPDAKRVLLTAYADTEAAIRAINEIKLHYYLLKPWEPPEQNLYPVLDDLLEDWKASYRPAFLIGVLFNLVNLGLVGALLARGAGARLRPALVRPCRW